VAAARGRGGSPGPGIVTEVLFRCRAFRIKEIPIQFRDRDIILNEGEFVIVPRGAEAG
jgi:hypothetical protein